MVLAAVGFRCCCDELTQPPPAMQLKAISTVNGNAHGRATVERKKKIREKGWYVPKIAGGVQIKRARFLARCSLARSVSEGGTRRGGVPRYANDCASVGVRSRSQLRQHRPSRFQHSAAGDRRGGSSARRSAARPMAEPAHQRLGIVQPAFQRRDRRRMRWVAQHDRRVAQQTAALGPPQRRVAKSAAKRFIVQFEEFCQTNWIHAVGRLKCRLARFATGLLASLVPRANFLTNVAAEEPIADARPQFFRDRRVARSSNS